MLIYLMRHGETDWNKARRFQGQSDIPLNDFGVELAVKTAEGLQDVLFDRVFSSPLKRAYTTAQIVVGDRHVEIEKDERLKEINFGPSEGQYFDPIKENPEHPLYAFMCDPGNFQPVDGSESIGAARDRAFSFLREKVFPLEGSCENVLLVAHGGINRTILNAVEGIEDKDFWSIALPNCAVSLLELKGGILRVLDEGKTYYGEPVNGRP